MRAEGRLRFPARFALVGAANPCPCGFAGDVSRRCGCPPTVIQRYQARIGGPLIDRIDIVIDVNRVDPALLLECGAECGSETMLGSVLQVRELAEARALGATASLSGAALLRACDLGLSARHALETVARNQLLSGRGVTRLLRVARTIADLDGCERVSAEHVAESIGFRAKGER